jgi:hypothetical protein
MSMMPTSEIDARLLLNKWKDEALPLAVIFSWRGIAGSAQRTLLKESTKDSLRFEGEAGVLFVSIDNAGFGYLEPAEVPPEYFLVGGARFIGCLACSLREGAVWLLELSE